jgi:hypothetical protein
MKDASDSRDVAHIVYTGRRTDNREQEKGGGEEVRMKVIKNGRVVSANEGTHND